MKKFTQKRKNDIIKCKTIMGYFCGGHDLAIDKEKISEIKNSVNIVDVIGEVVGLTKTGRNHLGLCPFHKEKTPSFNVIEDRQFFHCFGCGRSGDVFKFVEDYQHISFLDSVQVLAERSGIPLDTNFKGQVPKKTKANQSLLDIHRVASGFYHAYLMTTNDGERARQYLAERGVTEDLIKHFQIGLSPGGQDFLYRRLAKEFDEKTLMSSGLFNYSENSNQFYDSFNNRIMFPLTNDIGEVIAFSGRVWTQEDIDRKQAKYKNSRATPIFNKSYELYHLDKARAVINKAHEVYLMEGFMDVIAAYRAGIENVVASMGTALTNEHVRHLKRFTKKVVLTYDGDRAGQNAIDKSLELLSNMTVDIVRIPNKMDPDEFLQANSAEDFKQLLEKGRISNTEFYIHYLKPENTDNLQSEIAYVEKIAKLIAKSPSITAQNSYITKVAELLPDFDYFQVEQSVNNERLHHRSQQQASSSVQTSATVQLPQTGKLSAITKTEMQLFHRLLNHPYLLNEFRNRDNFYFDTTEIQVLYELLKESGEITSYDLSQESDKVNRTYYMILEEQLPVEVSIGEIEAVEKARDRLLKERDLRKQSQLIRQSSNQGDQEGALAALENLIAQKRNME